MNKKIIFVLLCLVVLSLSSCASAGKLQAPPMEAEKSAWVVIITAAQEDLNIKPYKPHTEVIVL